MEEPLLFRGRYRIPSTRKPGRDYGTAGRYFITVCTTFRTPWLGEIRNGIIGLSDAGYVAWNCWNQIPHHYPHVTVGPFIVMPDHVHGIITIGPRPETERSSTGPTAGMIVNDRVETPHGASLQHTKTKRHGHQPQWQSASLGSIINQYKSACTKHIHRLGYDDFTWQPQFHDRIIRTDVEYDRIAAYIQANPLRNQDS